MELITDETNLDYLITPLRLHLHDYTEPYDYADAFLRTVLVYAVKALAPRWNHRYLINTSNNVTRNQHSKYLFSPPPVVQNSDERAIVLQAAIDMKSSGVYKSSSTTVSWRDDEVSYSNIAGTTAKSDSLKQDIEELNALFPVAGRRLATPIKQSLPGFESPPNDYEG